ncbi:MAG: non-canonical purine NTP pyrophosphatase, partial [Actinobacteria bacterium]
ASVEHKIEKLLLKLKGAGNRRAEFVAKIVYYDTSSKIIVAEGKIEGQIIEEPKGSGGFGYDPVFVPEGYEATFGQMSAAEKNKLSHRGRTFRKLKEIFLEEGLIK